MVNIIYTIIYSESSERKRHTQFPSFPFSSSFVRVLYMRYDSSVKVNSKRKNIKYDLNSAYAIGPMKQKLLYHSSSIMTAFSGGCIDLCLILFKDSYREKCAEMVEKHFDEIYTDIIENFNGICTDLNGAHTSVLNFVAFTM